ETGAEGRGRMCRGEELPADTDGLRPLSSAADVRGAESWLLQSLIKRNEGFMSRRVERRVSLAVTRRLVETSVTPNAITLISVALGLLGALLFLSPSPAFQLAGARRFGEPSVTPNAITLISVALGLLGALLFLSPSPAFQLAGALLFLTHS